MGKRVPLDICRINTARLRLLTPTQIDRAYHRIQRGEAEKARYAQWGTGSVRGLVMNFVGELSTLHRMGLKQGPRAKEAWERQRQHVLSLEDKIWKMQAKRGCSIKPTELVARDAIRQEVAPSVVALAIGRRTTRSTSGGFGRAWARR